MFMAYVAFIALTSKDWNPDVENRDELCRQLATSRFLLPVFGLITVVIGDPVCWAIATADRGRCYWRAGITGAGADAGSLTGPAFKKA